MDSIAVKVVRKVKEAEDVFCYELARIDGAPLPPFSAGAHIDVHIGAKLTRQYSLCNDPTENQRYQIGVLRDPRSRGGSVAMHDKVHVGDTLKISPPKNHFPLAQADKTLLFAGGIGVTPILCMAERLARINADFEMHYCTRARERTAFLDRIKATSFASRVHFHFDDGPPDQKLILEEVLAKPNDGKHLYVCGPAGFIEHVVSTAKRLDWAGEHVHLEHFGAVAVESTGDSEFEVQIASTGKCYVIPAGRTVVEALGEQGIEIPVSCEQGICGTCITRVLGGTPDHRDTYFSDAERDRNDQFTPCCSRAKMDRLVLDI
ncbi:oxidoreductase [Noviherbaspirillum cavernae]|uniref:Oxidoreductase n=1 Tax=Noviherbaspirillum cavernae TaxID=2320862 RepID=A0A418WVE5_9BURK|nr:PDR/VanB family oxidoreductase [Noviherbaspirillum cavernae]RJF96569.1 oxidoreductase [Noviherbaspirillum cavernae]